MKILIHTLLVSLIVLKIEGMESTNDNFESSTPTAKITVKEFINSKIKVLMEEQETRNEEREKEILRISTLYTSCFQEDQNIFQFHVLENLQLQIYFEQTISNGFLNFSSSSSRRIVRFDNVYETLKFLKFLEQPTSKYRNNLIEIREQYEKKIKQREEKFKNEQDQAFKIINATYEKILRETEESVISIFILTHSEDFKSLHISVGCQAFGESIVVNFNNIDETSLFLEKLSNLQFLSNPIIYNAEEIIKSVEKVKQG